MSLFERIQNKRYDLQESGPNDPKFFTGKTEDKFQGSKEGKKLRNIKKKSTPSITRGSGIGPTERINPDDTKTQKTQNKIANQRVRSAQKSGKIDDFTNKPIEGAPDTKKLVRGKKGETIANPIKPTKKTVSKTSGTTQLKGVKDTELKPKTTGDEGQFRRNARRRKITGDVIPKKDLPKTKGVNQADVSKKAKEFGKQIEKKRVKKLAPIDLKKPTERIDLRKVKKRTTGRKRPSNAPSLADINKKIDAKNPVEMGKTGPKPVKGTVLKVDKGEFKRVRKTKVSAPGGINPEAKKIMSKQISSDELLGNKKKIEKKIVNNTKNLKNTSKPSLFKRAKDAVKGFHQYMVKDAGYRKTASQNLTRNTFKNTLRGNTLRTINKVLPGKYKALALAAAGTAIGIDQALKNRKATTSGVSTKKPVYKKAVKTLNLDTGKKNN